MIEGTILLVGCGKMGGALLKGWFAQGLSPVDIMIVEPAGRPAVEMAEEHPALSVLTDAAELPSDFTPDAILFAVKPQAAADVIPKYARFAEGGTVYLSIIAGMSLQRLREMLGPEAAVVRAMPNTPAAIGRGISVLCSAEYVGPSQKRVCKVLMAAAGQTAWIKDEVDMDAVTAVSGSGPAYVFLLAEALMEAGIRAGLAPALAEQLAQATVSGAGALLEAETLSASTLRENVTSPGGTTEAALKILMAEDGLPPLLQRAVEAATERSKDLSG
ncbi:MAG: pyrroline-5-carboxylate reductase [Rhodospirillaceae bacterium]|nr:pyrroline-5-carboxylate reductase [Rhodospirillaceae bacterium]